MKYLHPNTTRLLTQVLHLEGGGGPIAEVVFDDVGVARCPFCLSPLEYDDGRHWVLDQPLTLEDTNR